jgi:hypothetical protein
MNSSSWIWQEFSQEEEKRWRKLIADGRITKAGVESCMEEIARRSPEAAVRSTVSSRSGCSRQVPPCVMTLASPTHFVEGGGT